MIISPGAHSKLEKGAERRRRHDVGINTYEADMALYEHQGAFTIQYIESVEGEVEIVNSCHFSRSLHCFLISLSASRSSVLLAIRIVYSHLSTLLCLVNAQVKLN